MPHCLCWLFYFQNIITFLFEKLSCAVEILTWSDAVDFLTKSLGMPFSVVTAQKACSTELVKKNCIALIFAVNVGASDVRSFPEQKAMHCMCNVAINLLIRRDGLLLVYLSRLTPLFVRLSAAGPAIPIADIRGVDSMNYCKGEKMLRCKLASCYRLIDLYGWSNSIHCYITVSTAGPIAFTVTSRYVWLVQ